MVGTMSAAAAEQEEPEDLSEKVQALDLELRRAKGEMAGMAGRIDGLETITGWLRDEIAELRDDRSSE